MPTTQTRRPATRPKSPVRRTSTSGRRTSTSGRRTGTPARRRVAGGWIQRRPQPKQSAFKRALGGASGAIAGLGGRRTTPTQSHGKAKAGGGLAIVTAVAGLAFKNRDKLMARAKNRGQDSSGGVDKSDAQPVDVTNAQPVSPPRP